MENGLLLKILFLLILIGVNAFFAASEIAIISINPQKIKKRAEEGDKKANLLFNLTTEPSKFLATIQIGVTLAGLMASAVAAESFSEKLVASLQTIVPLGLPVIKLIAVIVITLILSYFQLVLGELVPKRLAMQKPERISQIVVTPICMLLRVSGPFVKLLSVSTNFVIRMFGVNPAHHEEKISEEEIRLMVEVGREKGVIQHTEEEMINNIFEFDNTSVSEVMTHRTNVIALQIDSSLDEVINTMVKEQFSRIPVYEGTIDNIIGILHVQDLVPALKNNKSGFNLKKIIRPAIMVPTSKMTDELFKELQRKKSHMAVVIDEYGGTAGIVTIEDLLEEIVGNIFDEHDEEIKEFEKIDEHTFLAEGTVSLNDLNDLLDVQLPESDDYDTLGGFITGQLGRIPDEDEKPVVQYKGYIFQVENIEDRRITKVRIKKK